CGVGLGLEVIKPPAVLHGLDGLFGAIAIGEWLLWTWYCFDLAISIWRLARLREARGFGDALGTGLCRRAWQRVNGSLDLPRGPWRGGRGALVWGLSAGGLLLSALGVAYIIKGGGVFDRLDEFAAVCDPAGPIVAMQCRDVSRTWAWQALAGFL